jgi:putative membrane protein
MKPNRTLLAGLAAAGLLAMPVLAQDRTQTDRSSQSSSSQQQERTQDMNQPGQSSRSKQSSSATSDETGSKGSANRAAGKSSADASFITKAAEGGMAEVELGKLATQKASNDQVKQFGQRMVDDHTKANDELKQIASQQGVPVPASLTAKHRSAMDRLSKLDGAEFDRAYMQMMVQDHREDVNEFKRESEKGNDSAVKAFAAKTLPTLQSHLQQAESIHGQVQGSKGQASREDQSKSTTRTRGSSSKTAQPDESGKP